MRFRFSGALLGLGAAVLSSPAFAAPGEPIGATLSVINVVTAEFNRDTRTLQTGDGVHQSELIEVGIDASSELKLNDNTKLALGAGSKLLLDKFVYDPEKSAGTIGVDLVKGAFRFITGTAEKNSYSIKIPKASITVRGTIFDVHVQPDQTSWVLLHEGAVTICNERGRCRDHSEPGSLIRVTPDGDVGAPTRWAGLPGKNAVPFDNAFPFVVNPPVIDPTPIFTREVLLRLGDQPKTPQRADDNGDNRPAKKTKRVEEPDEKPAKKTRKVEEAKPAKKKPVKTTKNSKNDEAAAKALGAAITIGVGIGLGSIGKKSGGNKPRGSYGNKNYDAR